MKILLSFATLLINVLVLSNSANANLGWGDVTDGGKQPVFYANSPSGIHSTCFVAPTSGTNGNSKQTVAGGKSVGVDPATLLASTPTVSATALVIGHTYQIVTVGASAFTSVGAKANMVGEIFVATASSTLAGTGTAMDLSACDSGTALRKFVDNLPVLEAPSGSNSPTYIPAALPVKWMSPDGVLTNDDYYEIAVMEYRHNYHTDLTGAGTIARGYVQIDPACTDSHGTLPLVADVNARAPQGSKCLALTDAQGNAVKIARPIGDGTYVLKQAYGVDLPHYLGPVISALHGVPTRVKFYNALPTGRAAGGKRNGDLPLPVDLTLSGTNYGPDGAVKYSQNRALLHLHGGDNPWISDGTPHQWIAPAAETGQFSSGNLYAVNWAQTIFVAKNAYITYNGYWYQNTGTSGLTGATAPVTPTGNAVLAAQANGAITLSLVGDACSMSGVTNSLACEVATNNRTAVAAKKAMLTNYTRGPSNKNVPDMTDPGPGATTYYYPNGLSAHTLWYHDHSYGLTRLNVYSGEASMYILQDAYDGHADTASPLYFPASRDIPLILQDKTFVPKDVKVQDAKWDGAANGAGWGVYGDLWYPHVIETNQNPKSSDNTSPTGRWDWGPWMAPPVPAYYGRLPTGEHVKITNTAATSGLDGATLGSFASSWAFGNPQTIALTAPAAAVVTGIDEVTLTPEAWQDTTTVNGKAYPTLTVQPDNYRFRALNGASDRFFNLGLYIAADRFSYAQTSPFDRPVLNDPVMCTGDVLDVLNPSLVVNGNDINIIAGNQYVYDGNYYIATSDGTVPGGFHYPVRNWKSGLSVNAGDTIDQAGYLYRVVASGTLGAAPNSNTTLIARGWTANSMAGVGEMIHSRGNVFNVDSMTNGVTAFVVTYEGKNYKSANVVITGGGCTTVPTTNVTLTNGKVTSVDILNPGAGCTSAPTVTITSSGVGYSPAKVTAYIGPTLGITPPAAPSDQQAQILASTVYTYNTANLIPIKAGDVVMLSSTFALVPPNTPLIVLGYTPNGKNSAIFNLATMQAPTVPLVDVATNSSPMWVTLLANVIQKNGGALLSFNHALEFNTDANFGAMQYLTNVSSCTEVFESDPAALTTWPTTGGLTGTGWGSKYPPGLFNSPVPHSDFVGPDIQMIMNEGGYLPDPVGAIIPSTPANWESNIKNAVFLNIAEMGWYLPPAVRSDAVVDFSAYRGTTLIMYNNAPAPLPAPDMRLSYYTAMGDQTGGGGSDDVSPGYGPNSRTMVQVYVDSNGVLPGARATDNGATQTAVVDYYNLHQPVPIVPQGTVGGRDTGGYMVPTAVSGIFAYSPLTFASQTNLGWPAGSPLRIGQFVKDGRGNLYSVVVEGILGADLQAGNVCGTSQYCVSGSVVLGNGAYKYTSAPTCTADVLLALAVPCATPPPTSFLGDGSIANLYVDGKVVFEGFDATYGRMNAVLGVELPPQGNVLVNTVIPLAYIDAPTENIADGQVYVWRIDHVGVDSHPIHFHLFEVQILNRVGIDGMSHPVTPEEQGWKETVVLSPLTTSYIAIRSRAPALPFGLPNSVRSNDPSQVIGATSGFSLIDPATGVAPLTPIVNASANYFWEYVWHCHILGHEESDFMRPVVFNIGTVVVPATPVNVTFTGATVAWDDATPRGAAITSYSHLISESGFTLTRGTTTPTPLLPAKVITLPANVNSYLDADVAGLVVPSEFSYYYDVTATNSAGTSTAIRANKVLGINAPTAVSVTVPTSTSTSVTVTYTDQSTLETGFHVYFYDATDINYRIPTAATCTVVQTLSAGTGLTKTCVVNLGSSNPGLIANGSYKFGVASYATNGTVGFTDSTIAIQANSAITLPLPAVSAFTAVATGTSTSSISLAWTNPSAQQLGTVVGVCTSNVQPCITIVGGSAVTTATPTGTAGATTVTGLVPNQTYYFGIKIGSDPAAPVIAASALTNPMPVTALTATAGNTSRCTANACPVDLTWANPVAPMIQPYTVDIIRTATVGGAITTFTNVMTSAYTPATYTDTTALPSTGYSYTARVTGSTVLAPAAVRTSVIATSTPASVTTAAVSVVSAFTAVASGSNQLILSWKNPASGIASVTRLCTVGGSVCTGIVGTPVALTNNVAGGTATVSYTGLAANSGYYVDVQVAITAPVSTGPATTASAITAPASLTALVQPTNPVVCSTAASCPVTLTWANANGASPYTVTISRTQTSPAVVTPVVLTVPVVTTTTFTDSTALPNTSYTYALTVAGSTVAPGKVPALVAAALTSTTVTTGAAPLPTVTSFTALRATALPTTSVTLTWTNPTAGAGTVTRACPGLTSCTGIASATVGAITVNALTKVATATVTGMLPNTVYNFDVTVGAGAAVTAAVATAPTPVTALVQATAASCPTATTCPITLNWASTNAASYTVNVTRTQTAPTALAAVPITVLTANPLTLTDNTAVAGATYTYAVSVVGTTTLGAGVVSAATSKTLVKPAAFVGPAVLAAPALSLSTTINLTWTNNSTAPVNGYVVQWSTTSGGVYATVASGAVTGTYTIGATDRTTVAKSAVNSGLAGTYWFKVIPTVAGVQQAAGASNVMSITY